MTDKPETKSNKSKQTEKKSKTNPINSKDTEKPETKSSSSDNSSGHNQASVESIKNFAVIESGGKQYKVFDGAILNIDRLTFDSQKKIIFDHVLLKCVDNETTVGAPYIKNYSIEGTVLNEIKEPKVIVFKFKRKTGYKKTQGHRQKMITVKVEKI